MSAAATDTATGTARGAATGTDRRSGPATVNAEQAGHRIEEVLDELTASGDSAAAAGAEELVRVLMEFYGAGLTRMVALLDPSRSPSGETTPSSHKAPGESPLARLLGDELVSSLLVLHGVHPEDTATRIRRALDSVRGHSAEVVSFDEDTGTLRLRSAGESGCGCASTADAARQAIEDALGCFAPEVTSVDMEAEPAAREPVLLQISRPPTGAAGAGPASAKTS